MIAQCSVLARLAVMTLVCGMGVYGATAAQAQDCSNEAGLRSASQGAPVELSFRNASNETRRLYWLDQNGTRRFISVIQASSLYRQPTAATHSWIVTDDAERCLHAVTATAEPQTIDIGGQTVARAAPGAGAQAPVAAAPARNIAVEPAQLPAPAAEPAPIAAPLASAPPEPERTADDATLNAASSDTTSEDMQIQVPQVSPIEQFGLNGDIRVLAVAEEGKSLNNQATGTVEVVRVNPEWDSGQWSFEPVTDSPFVRIRNNWKRTYLTDVNGQLRAVASQADADPSHWSIEPVDGTAYVQLRNRESDRFLLNMNGTPNLTNDYGQDQERQTYWQLNPAREQVAVAAPRMQALSAYNSAIADCRDIGGVWTGSSCRSNYAAMGYGAVEPLACRRGWFWDQESGSCMYEVVGSGAACPPWQQGPGGQCVSNLTCRGGHLRMSRRGASCDCPFGMAPWGNYPNLSCKPSVARIVPLLLMSKLGGKLDAKRGGPRFALGQAYGNKQFGKNQQTNVNNSSGLIIKVSTGGRPTNPGTNTPGAGRPPLGNPVVSNPILVNPNGPRPGGINTTGINPAGNNPGGIQGRPNTNTNTNTGINPNARPGSTSVSTTTNTNTNPGTPNNPTRPGSTTGPNNNPTQNTNQADTQKNDAIQAICRTNPNSPLCRGQQGTTTGRVTPPGTNPNLPPNNNQQAQNDARQKAEAEAKARADAATKQRADADAKQKADAASRAKIEADNRAKLEAANKARIEAANRARLEAANRAKAAADARAKADAANRARAAAEARARAEAAARQRAAQNNRPNVRPGAPNRCQPGRRPLPNGTCG